jgi:hypothetical protein
MTWRKLSESEPDEKEPVLLLMPGKYVPLVGYRKDNGDGPYWVIPGIGRQWGEPEWWCPIPHPYPRSEVEAFLSRRSGESLGRREV